MASRSQLIVHIRNGNADECISLLKQHNNKLSEKGPDNVQQPLHVAAKVGHEQLVDLLLDADPWDVVQFDEDGNTPLILAAQGGHDSCGMKIMEKRPSRVKANVLANMKNNVGSSALFYAALHSCVAMATVLINYEADLSIQCGPDLKTPLHCAAAKNCKDIVVALAASGSNLNAVDRAGRTPLITAVLEGAEEAVRALMAVGADPHVVDHDGWCAGEWADVLEHTSIKATLPPLPLRVAQPQQAEMEFVK
eukprot:Rmarinus@m.21351